MPVKCVININEWYINDHKISQSKLQSWRKSKIGNSARRNLINMQIIRISAVPQRCQTPKSTVRRTGLDGHCAKMGNETCQQVTRWWIITEFTGLNWKWFITGQDRCQMKFAWDVLKDQYILPIAVRPLNQNILYFADRRV